MHAYRTHTCGQLTADQVGETVRLSGWIHRKRDHGGVLFVDLRDHYGVTQIVCDSDSPALPVLEGLRVESVVTIDGLVKALYASPASLLARSYLPAAKAAWATAKCASGICG